jgi:hypothetical protein
MKSTLRFRKYPLQLPGKDARAVDQLKAATGLPFNRIVVLCVQQGLPVVRKSLAVKGEPVTNVKPLPKRVAERLYREREDDEASIRSFIQAQPVSSEE